MQPDDITDEMLYSQINSSKELRENITVFLRARGYISDADLQREMMDARDDAAQSYAFSRKHCHRALADRQD